MRRYQIDFEKLGRGDKPKSVVLEAETRDMLEIYLIIWCGTYLVSRAVSVYANSDKTVEVVAGIQTVGYGTWKELEDE